ncbi:hypothetical protein FB45DRAFT_909439 [Roridomyces roridus]|uniref:Sugar phosphate transporter domain-containing protein n=1 Tax=Roridomyces roridus TaxID=1738132 RepID=A0AAD7BYY9_9AGAR|nr:hypothetical protein FB45DRAFT_909439 [Roridomyces roridus]
MSPPDEQPPSKATVAAVVIFYMVAAQAMIVANKWVLNTTNAPLFFLLMQLIIAVVMFAIANVLRILPERLTFDLKICKGLVSMVVLNVIGLSSSNYTLKYVDASFYQVARGLVLPFTIATSFIMLHSRPSIGILLSCATVTAGFFLGVFFDGTPLSLVGIAFGAASSFITALASVVIKQSLPVVNGSTILLAWYTNVLSSFVLLPLVLLAGEGPSVLAILSGVDVDLWTFLWGSAITGGVGFAMSIAAPLSIKTTSPITHMVSAASRGVASTFLGFWLFGDIISSGRAGSIGVILAGSIYYTWVKHKESEAVANGSYERVPMDELDIDAEIAKLEAGDRHRGDGEESPQVEESGK